MRQLLSRILPLALVGVLAAGGIAYAVTQGGGPTNVLVACAKNNDGALRLVADASSCAKNEHAVELQGPIPDGQTEFTVDCAAGQKIQDAVWQADIRAPATIHVQGTCVEEVYINRDKVWLDAATPGSGITAPAGADSALSLENARDIELHGLTLTGGDGTGLHVHASTFSADGLHVVGPAESGIVLDGGSQGSLDGSTIENARSTGISLMNGGGTLQIRGGSIANAGFADIDCDSGEVDLDGVTIRGANNGVSAGGGCYVGLWGGTIEGNSGPGLFAMGTIGIENGAVVQNNGMGVVAQAGGTVWIMNGVFRGNRESGISGYLGGHISVSGATIEGNGSDGISLSIGSSAVIDSHTVVRNNGGNGIGVGDTSIAAVLPDTEVSGNGGWGIFCQPSPATAMIQVNGNLPNVSGGVSCPIGGVKPAP